MATQNEATSAGEREAATAEPSSGYWRLEDQISWYDRKSMRAQSMYKRLRGAKILAAAVVPVSALLVPQWPAIPGVLGAVILILEGFEELGAYQRNWIKYRSTCEALRHEKFLFLGNAGPYEDLDEDEARRELVNRVEALVSEEHAQWHAQMEARRAKERKAEPKQTEKTQPSSP